ncbi:MAG: type VI-D CRISPR-associated RNA-guided ribonuclease Cas13d, partial [Lachnospiraceae bacterium]|nr:type VI-D CRISPR-associated RNA-guided ribonuclease Cas13d [Lachnospiraceae bacterium]
GFLSKAGKRNLPILAKVFNCTSEDEKRTLLTNYYNYTVYKDYKNMGFSIKTLREHITADIPEAFIIRDKKYDSVRGKLNPFIDFVIADYYMRNPDQNKRLVEQLRASENEVAKDKIYRNEAGFIWGKVKDLVLNGILPEMDSDKIRKNVLNKDEDFVELSDRNFMITSEGVSVFVKIIHLMTLFMDGKEINILLTSLINKFENITAFIKVLKEEGLETGFLGGYSFFNEKDKDVINSEEVAKQLRIVNSFAHMSKPSANAKYVMFEDALYILGMDPEEIDDKLEYLAVVVCAKDGDHGLRNFIANNVLESDRFKYIVRYGNTRKIKKLVENEKVVSFVLKDIPDAQILRYYNSINETTKMECTEKMRKMISERLLNFSYADIENVRQNDKDATPKEQEEKRQKQALTRLYLAVLYLIVKNLVNINSRYFLAFHCAERDAILLDDVHNGLKAAVEGKDYLKAAQELYNRNPQKKKRVDEYIRADMNNADRYAIRVFRNKIEHLDAVRNADLYINDIKEFKSWFELYHYLLQRRIVAQYEFDSKLPSKNDPTRMVISEEELNPQTLRYFSLLDKYKCPCKDFIKALCVPFAYNLPRYKNLTIEGLFDKNRPGSANDEQAGEAAEENV